jgi:four helix bundle protein
MTNNQITITKHNFNLEERTLEFAKEVIRLCKRLPQNTINRELISQLIRASGSIGANYREGNDALSKKDFVYRIRIVRKEAKESHYWLQLMKEANNDFVEEIEKLITESFELKKIFSSIAEKSS